jgi:uncharacterized protein (TIGR02646 family)
VRTEVLRLLDVPLSDAALSQLDSWQAEVTAFVSYADRVEAAKQRFLQRNTPRNKTFATVRRALEQMCTGTRRCGYCEDSEADEIDHLWPKELYPELAFAWRNYLYACGRCNRSKSYQFAVFPRGTRRPVEVSRHPGDAIRPPRKGTAVLIDPRYEDPMAFIELDLQGTFIFVPVARKGSRDYERANYTLRILRLNDREVLREAREEHFGAYRARLKEYIALRERGAPKETRERHMQAIRRAAHPTVWKEMQRQHRRHPELLQLFLQAPEALGW